uniref:Putative ATP synthase epsilon chain (ATP synthase F1 sector epsilon subunit), AtpC n=1 Tax=mine drainage metagenome TaxID=410659 RepID=E6QTI8_9ZZZZ
MNLKLSLPEVLLLDVNNVTQVIVETIHGSMGILPHRLDGVAALVPGILVYDLGAGGRQYVAVDEGMLVKVDETVLISVHNALAGEDLDHLQAALLSMQTQRDTEDRDARVEMARVESGLLRRLVSLHHA